MKKSDDVAPDPEENIRKFLMLSRDRAAQRKEFAQIFARQGGPPVAGFNSAIRDLWDQLTAVILIIRQPPGASFTELMKQTRIPAAELRRTIRMIITLGDEIEVICKDWQTATDGRFFLHN